jgi:hypothetical protein
LSLEDIIEKFRESAERQLKEADELRAYAKKNFGRDPLQSPKGSRLVIFGERRVDTQRTRAADRVRRRAGWHGAIDYPLGLRVVETQTGRPSFLEAKPGPRDGFRRTIRDPFLHVISPGGSKYGADGHSLFI